MPDYTFLHDQSSRGVYDRVRQIELFPKAATSVAMTLFIILISMLAFFLYCQTLGHPL